MAGAIAAPAAKVQGASSEGAAGEAAAQGYYVQNRATFATYLPAITLGQTAAALAEGELEGPRAGGITRSVRVMPGPCRGGS